MTRCAAAALLAATLGCFHTRHVAKEEGGAGAPAKTEQGENPHPAPGRVPARGGRPTIAAEPEGLMNPGALRRIQAALRSKGYLREPSGRMDEATSVGLRRFQRDQDLAATGAPDRETLERLGIDPNSVYRTTP